MSGALLLALLLGFDPSPAPAAHGAEPPAAAAPAGEAPEGHPATPPGTAAHGAATPHDTDDPAAIVMHHVTDVQLGHLKVGPLDLGPTKHLLYIVGALLMIPVVLRLAIRQYGANRVPRGIGAMMETLLVFIRDEIAVKNIGHDGHRYTPLLANFFFFILVSALIGLMPFQATATGNISVTLALALVSFLATQWAGIQKYGFVHHFAGMVPPGLPWFLVPIMIIVEFVGLIARPFALTVRLFANMIAGHMVITTLLLLIPLMAKVHMALGVAMIPVSLGLALFIMFLEILVAFLQAFIFTLLSSIFIGMAVHPAH